MASCFITNDKEKNFGKRVKELIEASSELKFLVGFFYFSGYQKLYETLKELYNKNQLCEGFLKILVGLKVDKIVGEIAVKRDEFSPKEIKDEFFESIVNAFQSNETDRKEVYEQVEFFLKLLEEGILILRKTEEDNHAKLYIFKMKEDYKRITDGVFITGSSNLTAPGLGERAEFNVEIKDYGFEEAEKYFDELWESAVEISKDDVSKLSNTFKEKTPFRKTTPLEAYAYILKTYLDLQKAKIPIEKLKQLFEEAGYKPYNYQLEAVLQGVSNCGVHNGTILADVVGLGKTVVACLIAKLLNKRGIVICPPHLVGDESKSFGWKKYLEDFKLWGWEVWSLGKLEEALDFVKKREDIEVVIVDEAHRFRNEKTLSYHLLREICRGKKVILLSATPFNNRPSDIFSLIKLFNIPKKSTITLDEDLETRFEYYEKRFEKLAYIKNHYKTKDERKKNRVKEYYEQLFGNGRVDLRKVEEEIKSIAQEIRGILEPIVIRRNRLDLKYYKDEIPLPEVKDPEPKFFELSRKQMEFYDEVIKAFMPADEGGEFKGAIYMPIKYEKGIPLEELDEIEEMLDDEEAEIPGLTGEESFLYLYQSNLYNFMRRLLVKRFESSIGAFKKSVENFKNLNKNALEFIKKTNKFILDRKLMEEIYKDDPEEIEKRLQEYEENLKKENIKDAFYKVYDLSKFKQKGEFIKDIENDMKLFERLEKKIDEVFGKKDPKADKLIKEIERFLKENRKVVIFTEYVDTASYLRDILQDKFGEKLLPAFGNLSQSTISAINRNFDASYKQQEDKHFILLTTDKLSEGVNLNRAGAVINYDIPWNPVRVIQRVGRVNRVGKKVYNEIYIVNFFPTEQGADVTRSKEIAQTKMFMIHKILGEDAKIFDPSEEPQPSELYKRLTTLPEEDESFYSKVKKDFEEIVQKFPKFKEDMEIPKRVKVAKKGEKDELIVFMKKGKDIFIGYKAYDEQSPQVVTLEKIYEKIRPNPLDEPQLPLSEKFWDNYYLLRDPKQYKKHLLSTKKPYTPKDPSTQAINVLKSILNNNPSKIQPHKEFINDLIEDLSYYRTLSKYIVSEIKEWEKFLKDEEKLAKKIEELKNEIGEDFLKKVKELKKPEIEILIAIENQKGE